VGHRVSSLAAVRAGSVFKDFAVSGSMVSAISAGVPARRGLRADVVLPVAFAVHLQG
jgi:hypothetical protein